MHICVLGAGVIGTTTAHQLLNSGHEVTLIDAQAATAQMASLGNGAQLSYSYVAPLADPSVWRKWPEYLFSPDSPLTFKPQLATDQWRWMLQFLAASNARKVKQSTIDLLQLAMYSRQQMQQLDASNALHFSYHVPGKLVMLSDSSGLQAASSQVAFQAEYGCRQTVLPIAACVEIEPALAVAQQRWVGGVYTPSEAVGDCPAFCAALLEEMNSSKYFEFFPNAVISDVLVKQNRLAAVKILRNGSFEAIHADQFVLALGADSSKFASKLGFHLPVYPLKGYSITVPLNNPNRSAAPEVSVTDLSRKIVYARLGDTLRVAGRVELMGMNRDIPQRAIKELVTATAELFPACGDLSESSKLSPWSGLRPATPTGLPIIGRSPLTNVFLNVGHGALGWTLACGSAALLSAQMNGHAVAINDAPYRL